LLQNLTAKHLEAEASLASLREEVKKLIAQGLVIFLIIYFLQFAEENVML